MDVNFEYYKIFYYVAKYHNFTKAAQALNNSQPNITRAMNCLEQQLNTTLFIRTNRGVQLTPEGERLYTHVLGAMEQFQAAEEELADSSGLSHGSVAIGASETALNIFLLDKLKNFHMTYPGIRLKLYNHSTPEAIESVKKWKDRFCSSFHSGRGGLPVETDHAHALPGDPGWRYHVYRPWKPGAFPSGGKELSADFSWTGNYDL